MLSSQRIQPDSRSTKVGQLAFFLQLLLGASGVALGVREGVPWPGIVGLGLAGALAASVSRTGVGSRSDLAVWWCCSLGLLASLLFGPKPLWVADLSRVALADLLGATGLVASLRLSDAASMTRWRTAGIAWTLAGAILWIGVSYSQNLGTAFSFGLIFSIVLLSLCKPWFQPSLLVIQGLNTLILVAAGFFLLALAQRAPSPIEAALGPIKPVYRYADAMKDPAGFRRWWSRYTRQWAQLLPALFESHPGTPLFYRPRPGHQAMFLQSCIVLNRLGFRGKEIADSKGSAYRIVALGESTTFGSTINSEDKPWPELLEQMIRERLKPQRPIEVVNAGTPSFGLTNNLFRLANDILPLKPDMLISYHGYNGFDLLHGVAPPQQSLVPPVYLPRPVKLLADCEYRLRLMWYRHRRAAQRFDPATAGAAMQSEYARAYRELIGVARTNSIRLVLSTYSMAVNQQSDPAIITFFRNGFPEAPACIKANEVHSLIVRRLSEENPGVIFVDSHPGLDGEHDLFLDLMHFTQAGDQKLAEAVLNGIKGTLERDLACVTNQASVTGGILKKQAQ